MTRVLESDDVSGGAGAEASESNDAAKFQWQTPTGPFAIGGGAAGRSLIMVGNRTGGQGKTLVTEILLSLLTEERQVIAADSVEAVGASKKSKLGRIFDDVDDVGCGPSAEEMKRDPKVYRKFWDGIGLKIAGGRQASPVVMDFGANVIDSMISWARDSHVGDFFSRKESLVAAELVIPFVASPQAIGDALSIARELARGDVFPVRRIVFLCNEVQGSFERFRDTPEMLEIRAMARKFTFPVIKLSRCDAGLLRLLEKNDEPKVSVLDKSVDDIGAQYGLNFFEASRELEDVKAWLEQARDKLSSALKLVREVPRHAV
ncbi:MAG: hypothetical protein EPN75_08785 [Beijerinckiaceae bacterium]|nr:MAG: hypothetical protein EPN75_08785 [Beijerinckiaceae bacterium]